jgi:hypothetical protein
MKNLMLNTASAAVLVAGFVSSAMAQTSNPVTPISGPSCPLANPNSKIKHIVYLQYDNVHYERDRINVQSDLEQMPAMLSFLQSKGTLLTNDHTQVISHTADGIITSITGVYPDRHGQGVSNSYDYFKANGSTAFVSSFVYWTNKVQTTDPASDQTFALVNEAGLNAPSPWAAYTKAGCDFGAVSLADMELENTTSDVQNVFGPGSPESQETSPQNIADFEGIAIHCAVGSTICSKGNAKPDVLPNEPGGYDSTRFQALFGHKYAVPAIANGNQEVATGVLRDLEGAPITYNNGSKTANGFPGFDGMFPKVTLAYVAQMLEAGVPVVYGYISDAHDAHVNTVNTAYGPGEQGYHQQLVDYNTGWTNFFTRMKADGFDETNTLFIITTEEGDHFVGGPPNEGNNCDGVTTFCTYKNKGEVDVFANRLLSAQKNNNTTFDLHFDMSPNAYIAGNPAYNAPVTRQLEHDMMSLQIPDPVLANRNVPMVGQLADRVEQKMLHMTALGDPNREPTFTPFAYQDFFVETSTSAATVGCQPITVCVLEAPGFAWNHGGISNDINHTWVGIVGPGVHNDGVDSTTWTDHVDYRPTILMLAGIQDSYVHDGRVVVEHLDPAVLPPAIASNLAAYESLVAAYKQLTAPYGSVAVTSLGLSTRSVALDDPSYGNYVTSMTSYLGQRDSLTTQIKNYIDAAAFTGGPFTAAQAASFTSQANALIGQMQTMAAAGH